MSRWMAVAFKYEGLREIKGPKHSDVITGWLDKLGAWWRDDETPWCGVYVAAVMHEVGYSRPRYYMRAKAWLDWGVKIPEPVYGCVAILDRKGGGHVGFVVGMDDTGRLQILGGNQDNEVNIRSFGLNRVLGYRVPPGFSHLDGTLLPIRSSNVRPSTTEA